MNSVDKAVQTQLENIQKKTGLTLAELQAKVRQSGLSKHGEIRDMLKGELGLGYGDANTLTHAVLQAENSGAAREKGDDQVLTEIYTGAKEALLPIHQRLMEAIHAFGEFEIAPKKGYLSLRRKKQFAMIGPTSNTRVEVGLNHKMLGAHDRLLAQPSGSMCNFVVRLTQPEEVDADLIGWIRSAYDSAG